MRRRIAKTKTGKSLQSRLNRITPRGERGLTESQVRYRQRKKKVEEYWKHEAALQRRRW